MENTKNENKPVWFKVLVIVGNCFFYIFILFLLFFAISNISAKNNEANIPNIFGVGMLNVITDSMEGTDKDKSIYVDDLIFVKMPTEKAIKKLEIGKSIITFYDPIRDMIITHRLVDIIVYSDMLTIYVTQGDKVAVTNPDSIYVPGSNDFYLTETVEAHNILAIYTDSKIGGGGKLFTFLSSPTGFGLCIVLPTALLLGYQGYVLIKNIFKLNKHKLELELAEKAQKAKEEFDPEEEKRRIREELLREMENKNTETENKE